jgi:hypothetical protein
MRSKGSSLTNYIEAQQKEKYFIFCKSYFHIHALMITTFCFIQTHANLTACNHKQNRTVNL